MSRSTVFVDLGGDRDAHHRVGSSNWLLLTVTMPTVCVELSPFASVAMMRTIQSTGLAEVFPGIFTSRVV